MDNRELEFNSELPRKHFLKPETKQNEHPNKNMMGTATEMRTYPKFQRLRQVNGIATTNSNGSRVYRFYCEASKILGQLNLSLKLRSIILKEAEKFYHYFKKNSYSRGESVLIPVAVYLTCLERFIFVKRKDFYVYCTARNFSRCLNGILKNNANLRQKFHSDIYRQKLIKVQLNGLKDHFYLNESFFIKSCENLQQKFSEIKNATNTAIAGAIFDLTTNELMGKAIVMAEVCRFLGINQSTIIRRRLYV